MRTELEKQLQIYAPIFLRDLHGDIMKTGLAFGIECGDGWYIPLRNLFFCIERLNTGLVDGHIICDQVKCKFGDLCVYWHFEDQEETFTAPETIEYKMRVLLEACEALCNCTCEKCGALYNPNTRRRNWVTLCPDCAKDTERHNKDKIVKSYCGDDNDRLGETASDSQ